MNILIVDDHALFRCALKGMLSEVLGAGIIDEASTGEETFKKFRKRRYDCIILDIYLPGENGLEILQRLKSLDPDAHCLVLSMYSEAQYGLRAIKAGAAGYLTKNVSLDVLKEAIRRICSGQKYIDVSLAERLSDAVQYGNRLPHERLSDRELQILVMIASGKIVTQIARELHLSVKTISTHRANILRKMELENTSQLIHYALKNALMV
jgi:two-component system, NarL family, invasion response regulator UvrY